MSDNNIKTELPLRKYKPIDTLNLNEAIDVIIEEQLLGIKILKDNNVNLQLIIENVYNHLKKFPEGRLIYCGAGTSGRVAIQDAVELYPTFGWPKERIGFMIAGGEKSLTSSVESAEDNIDEAKELFNFLEIDEKDVVFGIAASGNTPYTCEVMRLAQIKSSLSIAISNNDKGKILNFSDFSLVLDTGEEVVAGSTRMKAGTVQKVCLNIISTMLMVKFGHVKDGLMNNMVPLNKKLKIRKTKIDQYLNNN